MATNKLHPCLTCGACCATFTVAFYWRETEAETDPVPEELSVAMGPFKNAMKGTEQKQNRRCVALDGTLGRQVHCTIYKNRPSVCRKFGASFENGIKNPNCDRARELHGLRPLTRLDWKD